MDEEDRKRFDYEWAKLKARCVSDQHALVTLRQMAEDRGGPPEHIVDDYVRTKLEKEKLEKERQD